MKLLGKIQLATLLAIVNQYSDKLRAWNK